MAKIKHSEREHALLSASSASRWIACTPSARLEEKIPDGPPSIFADEGTLAHEFGDLLLKYEMNRITEKEKESGLERIKSNPLYDPEMDEEVEKYINYVMETFRSIEKDDAILLIEEKLDFSHIVEEGFGTGDVCIISDGVLEVIDLKYGKGIRVDAENNPQLRLYGIGAYNSFELFYDIHSVKMTIVQPRLDHISSELMTVADLTLWGEKIVKPAAAKAYLGKGVQKTGDHCRWCKAKATCATLAAENIKLAKHEFKDPHLLSEKQLLEVYEQIPKLTDWAKAVHEHLLREALEGKKWKGYKLVEGRSQRKWKDEDKVIESLRKEYKDEEFMVTKLVGIPAVEKLVGKKEFPEKFSNLVLLPPGKPTLVPESDKRPAMGNEQAKIDFQT